MFEDTTAFVTGASRGIGRAIATRFVEEGGNAAIAARSDAIYDVAAALGEDSALAVETDVADERSVAAAVETSGDAVENARVAVTGATDRAVRLAAVEEALTGEALSPDTIAAAARRATDDLGPATLMDDARASGEFREQLLEPYTERAVRQVAERV